LRPPASLRCVVRRSGLRAGRRYRDDPSRGRFRSPSAPAPPCRY
jgi:hypothetical protein